jgi:hypothetical protein
MSNGLEQFANVAFSSDYGQQLAGELDVVLYLALTFPPSAA